MLDFDKLLQVILNYTLFTKENVNMPENPDVMTVEEVAEYLRISERTVYDWAQKGEIPGGKIGSSWRFSRKRIEEWLNDRLSGSHHARTSLTATINLVGFWKPEHTLIINSPISKPK